VIILLLIVHHLYRCLEMHGTISGLVAAIL
jgi:hypothetical protein